VRSKNKGFTLIEILVVVVIVAVLMSAVTLSFPPTGDKLLKEQAERFSALVGLAQDEAILQSRELALEVNNTGYVFYRNVDNSWSVFADAPFAKREFPADISSKIYIDGIAIDLEEREELNPQVLILSSGEMTPFSYKLSYKNKSEITLKINAVGEIEQTFVKNE
jgi:general secretion pathway protein H